MKIKSSKVNVLILPLILALASLSVSAGEKVLMKANFSSGATGWKMNKKATLSDISRTKGAKSLVIHQENDDDAKSSWTSPPMKNPGVPIKVSFWTADNYTKCPDFTYAAQAAIVNLDKKGKTSRVDSIIFANWDANQKQYIWGKLLPEGLVWKYHEAVYTPKGDTFQFQFSWKQAMARGDCYLTDLMITTGSSAKKKEPQIQLNEKKKSPITLEISTPVSGNLFYKEQALRFEILLYSTDGKPLLALPKKGQLVYEIRDFEKHLLAHGVKDLAGMKPVTAKNFYKSIPGKTRAHNLHKKIIVNTPAVREAGRLYFITVKYLNKAKKIVASDTVTYGVVDPLHLSPKEKGKSNFAMRWPQAPFKTSLAIKGRTESINNKMGVHWDRIIDYHAGKGIWHIVQPKFPGPFTFKEKLPEFPLITFCPNMEQMRGRQGAYFLSLVPKGALLDDPLKSGKKMYDLDAYVQYILAFIRHNRKTVKRVLPTGLERHIDGHTAILHRKAYAAIKKEFPDVQVGMMLYSLSSTPSAEVDWFFKEKLYECTDYINTHSYTSSFDWRQWKRIQDFYAKELKRPAPMLTNTECYKVASLDQVTKGVASIAFHLDALAHGMTHIHYFNHIRGGSKASGGWIKDQPNLRGPAKGQHFLFVQRVDRPRVSEAISDAGWGHGYYHEKGRRTTVMPMLHTMTYHNMVKNFDLTVHRETLHPTPESVAYVFDKKDSTRIAMWLEIPVKSQTFLIKGNTPFIAQDFFGTSRTITPLDGLSLITIDDKPITLIFPKRIEKIDIKVVDAGLALKTLAAGGKGDIKVLLPALFAKNQSVTLSCSVDSTWPQVKKTALKLKKGVDLSLSIPVSLHASREPGQHTLLGTLKSGKNTFGLLHTPLVIASALSLELEGVPLTAGTQPGIKVTLRNNTSQVREGVVSWKDDIFSTGFRDKSQEKSIRIKPNDTAAVFFPVNRQRINMTATYTIKIDYKGRSGGKLEKTEFVSFRATEKAPGKITIDGDLSEWNLEKLTPVPFGRGFTLYPGGVKHKGPEDTNARLYTLWDNENIYLALVVSDDVSVVRANTASIWVDDNIMLGLYPWGWKKGGMFNQGFYRSHLGPCKDGTARIFRLGAASGGSMDVKDASIAVKRTKTGYVYEWSYPKKLVSPLDLRPGSRYRLSLTLFDRDDPNPKGTRLLTHGVMLGGFNVNTNSDIGQWPEFVLTK
ncbi:MAG: hypothetical protein MJH11_11400 [Lentisphaeria bacterium]|nr:hypothetical protein [Lentisphaeria bacterium]